jgi:hypothetical protein
MALTHQALELALATALAMVGYATLNEMQHFFIACFAVLAVAVVLLVIRAVRKEPTPDDKCTEDDLMRATPTGVSIAAGLVGLVVFGLTVFTKREELHGGVMSGYEAVRSFDPEMMYHNYNLQVKQKQVDKGLRGDQTLHRAKANYDKMLERRASKQSEKDAATAAGALNQINRLTDQNDEDEDQNDDDEDQHDEDAHQNVGGPAALLTTRSAPAEQPHPTRFLHYESPIQNRLYGY